MIEDQISKDLKEAMLAKQSLKVDTLRGIKSVFLYARVASGNRDNKLADQEAIALLAKESKKRQESADLYKQGNDQNRAAKELEEKKIIDSYLPEQLSEEDLSKVIDDAVNTLGSDANLGQVIGYVKQKTAGAADGALIARLVKEKLSG